MMDVEMTEVGRNWPQECYPQGIPYRIPPEVDGKPTLRRAHAETD